ncbi:MAG: DNA translocase FtsK 4TM domain-containing protein, partial [Alphaproteobacteria bacterium]
MARSTVIKHTKPKRKKTTSGIPFLPESLQAFMARRCVDVLALGLAFSGGFLILAFASYNASDASWNSAGSSQNIQNYMGVYGAYYADLFLQSVGLAAFLAGFCLLIWGIKTYKRQKLGYLPLRIMALLITPFLGALALAQIPSGDFLPHPYMGASAGTIMLDKIQHAPGLGALAVPPVLISLLAGILCITAFVFAAAIQKQTLLSWAAKAANLFAGTVLLILHGARSFAAWISHYNNPDDFERSPRIAFQWPQLSFTRDDRDDDLIAPSRPAQSPATERAAPSTNPAQDTAPAPEKKTPHIPVVAKPAKAQPQAVSTEPPQSQGVNQQRFALNDSGEWEFPPMEILQDVPADQQEQVLSEDALRKNAELLQNVLNDFSIQGDIVSIHPGPVVTLYEFEPAPGTKSQRIISLADDIARSMSAISVRCAVVPGRNVIGIELPNKHRQFVFMKEILMAREVQKSKAHLPLILGKDIGGGPIMADLAKMPHLLVAGTTGSGKSVAVNTMILSLLYRLSPEKCRFIMIDPKMLELSVYDDIPHLLSPVVTEPGKAVVALKWTVAEMENRYRAMSKLGVRNIEGYNERLREAAKKGETIMHKVQTGFDPETGEATYEDQPMDLTELPYIVVVVDEFADLMLVAGKDVENAIQRLAQMAR